MDRMMGALPDERSIPVLLWRLDRAPSYALRDSARFALGRFPKVKVEASLEASRRHHAQTVEILELTLLEVR